MSELIERYVYQVGGYLSRAERAEVEAELRSQLYDTVDNRFGERATPEQVAAVLKEFGAPHQIALSYGGGQYLVGPALYPHMMRMLRVGWMTVPALAAFLTLFGALSGPEALTPMTALVLPLLAALQAVFAVTSLVVVAFAIIQHSGIPQQMTFDPQALPAVDDPRTVDRLESIVGIALAVCVTAGWVYFISVGGLTLRFHPRPEEIVHAPVAWMAVMIILCLSMGIVHLMALRRGRWTLGQWGLETLIEVMAMIGLYFAFYQPIHARLMADHPALAANTLFQGLPELLVVLTASLTFIGRGVRLARLWNYER